MMGVEDKMHLLWLQPRDVVVIAVVYLDLISAIECASGVSHLIGKMKETLREVEKFPLQALK